MYSYIVCIQNVSASQWQIIIAVIRLTKMLKYLW